MQMIFGFLACLSELAISVAILLYHYTLAVIFLGSRTFTVILPFEAPTVI